MLRNLAISGLKWSFIDSFLNQGIQVVIGIILARLLTPKDFGLIGMITVFIAISQSFVDSGFSQALIRKQDCKKEDYNTVFYFNLLAAVAFYGLLYFASDYIALFFKEPLLSSVLKVMGLLVIINSVGLVQKTILIKDVDFKFQAKMSIVSSVISGFLGIVMAVTGWGSEDHGFRLLKQVGLRSVICLVSGGNYSFQG